MPVAGPLRRLENRPAPADVGSRRSATRATTSPPPSRRTASASTDAAAAPRRSSGSSAFTGQLLDRLATPDGLVDIEEHEHAAAFTGARRRHERHRPRAGWATRAAPLIAGAPGRSEQQPRRRGRSSSGSSRAVSWAGRNRYELLPDDGVALRRQVLDWTEPRAAERAAVRGARVAEAGAAVPRALAADRRRARREAQPAPPRRRPLLARRPAARAAGRRRSCGAPSLVDLARVAADARQRRRPRRGARARARGAAHESVPLAVARGVAAKATGTDREGDALALPGRVGAALRRATRDTTGARRSSRASSPPRDARRRCSSPTSCAASRSYEGVEPDPVGVTAWSQPWIPLWLEWEARADRDRRARRLDARADRPRAARPRRRRGAC